MRAVNIFNMCNLFLERLMLLRQSHVRFELCCIVESSFSWHQAHSISSEGQVYVRHDCIIPLLYDLVCVSSLCLENRGQDLVKSFWRRFWPISDKSGEACVVDIGIVTKQDLWNFSSQLWCVFKHQSLCCALRAFFTFHFPLSHAILYSRPQPFLSWGALARGQGSW